MEINSVSPSKPPRRFLLATTALNKQYANVAPFILFFFWSRGSKTPTHHLPQDVAAALGFEHQCY